MQIDATTVMAALLPIVAGVVWAVRLEGRINANENRVSDMRADLTYIRQRIDAFLGGQ